jgi:hypothetical protein
MASQPLWPPWATCEQPAPVSSSAGRRQSPRAAAQRYSKCCICVQVRRAGRPLAELHAHLREWLRCAVVAPW